MALTDTNKGKICQILNVLPEVLDYQLDYRGATFTATHQTLVEAQITLWDAGAGTKRTRLRFTESNKGVETDPAGVKQDIRERIAVLLGRPDWAGTGNYLPRG